jgi:endogenous inhibitor of DNA gyrase (YacG/DUF329 family)
MLSEVKCPQCKKVVPWQDNPHRPFCSERCRELDLGSWASEDYKITGRPVDPMSDDITHEFHKDD